MVKPIDAAHGNGVTTNIRHIDELQGQSSERNNTQGKRVYCCSVTLREMIIVLL